MLDWIYTHTYISPIVWTRRGICYTKKIKEFKNYPVARKKCSLKDWNPRFYIEFTQQVHSVDRNLFR